MKREEAINIVRNIYQTDKEKEALATLIPELRESEDERIRKELKEAFEAYDIESKWNGIPIRSIFAWLEKQKEKSEIPIMDGDTDTYFDDLRMTTKPLTSREWFDEGIKYAQRLQKEQKPVIIKPHKGDDGNPYDMGVSEAQEYAINRGFGIPFNDGEVFVDERYIIQTIGNILRWADEHPKEQKPAEWSEDTIRKAVKEVGLTQHQIDWFKNNVFPPKQEWGEEDSKRYISIGATLATSRVLSREDYDADMSWLRDLVNIVKYSRLSWKPSEEEMKALKECGECKRCIKKLYEDLQKRYGTC